MDCPKRAAGGDMVRDPPVPAPARRRAVTTSGIRGRIATLYDVLARAAPSPVVEVNPAVRGDLLQALGRNEEARTAFHRAASLAANERERQVLLRRAAACWDGDAAAPS